MLRALTLAVLVVPSSVSAQAPAAHTPVACTYETCALRIEPSFFAAPKLVRGRAGQEVGRLGPFGGGVDTLLAGPDSAAVYGSRYVVNMKRSSTLGLIGTAAFVVALVRSDSGRDADAATTAFALAGTGFAIASIPFALRASRSLSRAVWFYNAVLPTR